MVWGGRREEGSGWGTHVCLWRIHFDPPCHPALAFDMTPLTGAGSNVGWVVPSLAVSARAITRWVCYGSSPAKHEPLETGEDAGFG